MYLAYASPSDTSTLSARPFFSWIQWSNREVQRRTIGQHNVRNSMKNKEISVIQSQHQSLSLWWVD